ncbi:DUF4910 domain-containing protein [Lusitaniella coriacea]|nr:DUF4910 domain-containing protein [Lusitaniella coriacea]
MNSLKIDLTSEADRVGQEMYQLVERLYPLCRSITGDGVRETLKTLKNSIPLNICEVPSGTAVFDWTIPKEWNIRSAWIKNDRGEKVVDFQDCNLHVLSYSIPIHCKLSLTELKQHLYTIPSHPDWIPYRTSYYKENWGFCLSHEQYTQLQEGEYEVYIDSSLEDGSLTYGEYYLPGETKDEILISCHICHPSLCNDNLSGITIASFLAKSLKEQSRRYSYRFLFVPGTIGAIAWLALNESKVSQIKHGLVLTCLGDSGSFTYKKSRRGNAEIDRAVEYVLQQSGQAHEIVEFSPYGYDERQYCSPGFNLAVGCFMRSPHGTFPEYHTSADNLDFITPEQLGDSWIQCRSILQVLEGNRRYINQNPKCEPQLGKRGLYEPIGGHLADETYRMAMLWVLNLSDGTHSLLQIARRSRMPFDAIARAVELLSEKGLLVEAE